MKKSKEALKILISGETNAVYTYEKYSLIAFEEGYKKISELFTALAKAELIHIKNHERALNEEFTCKIEEPIVSDTLENIKNAINGEREESKYLYPGLIKKIKSECKTEYGKVARLSMIWAQKVEKEHGKLLKKALKLLLNGNDMTFNSIYLCQVCGNIQLDKNDEKECTVCGHDFQFFSLINGDS